MMCTLYYTLDTCTCVCVICTGMHLQQMKSDIQSAEQVSLPSPTVWQKVSYTVARSHRGFLANSGKIFCPVQKKAAFLHL